MTSIGKNRALGEKDFWREMARIFQLDNN